jgi:deoxyribonuclease IV
LNQTDSLLFGTAGVPHSSKQRSSISGIERLKELGLDIMELEYVRGSFPGESKAREISAAAKENGIRLSAHGPYYINLNAVEPEKLVASRERIMKTAILGSMSGAETITFHAGFFLGQDPELVYGKIKDELEEIVHNVREMDVDVDIRPELTGKYSQFGSIDELMRLSLDIKGVSPCIDWSHQHAKTGAFNTTDEFQSIIDTIRDNLGETALKSVHFHISGIDYGPKGEKKHLELEDSDFNYRDLLKVLKKNEVCGFVICESPTIEDDALLLKNFYEKL